MQARNFHVPSLVIGVLAATVVLMSMGQSSPVLGPPRIEYGPHPRDMVQIKEGTPYTVPVGRIFVLTGLGSTLTASGLTFFKVNGEDLLIGGWSGGVGGQTATVAPIPMGCTVAGGSVISLVSGAGQGRAWGYLSQP